MTDPARKSPAAENSEEAWIHDHQWEIYADGRCIRHGRGGRLLSAHLHKLMQAAPENTRAVFFTGDGSDASRAVLVQADTTTEAIALARRQCGDGWKIGRPIEEVVVTSTRNPDVEAIAAFFTLQIENGLIGLDDIPAQMARYGLMAPADFAAEMAERMSLSVHDTGEG